MANSNNTPVSSPCLSAGPTQPWKKWYQPSVNNPGPTIAERAIETYDDSQNGKGPTGTPAVIFNLE